MVLSDVVVAESTAAVHGSLAPSKPRLRVALLYLLLLAVVAVQLFVFRWKPVDDAFISFRYARNLAEGHGLVFNPGQRVEGYSNPLWTLLLAGVAWAGFDLPGASCVLGLLFIAGDLWLTWLLARRTAAQRGWPAGLAWIAPALLALYPGTAYWAFGGMEGPMAMFLVLGFWLLACDGSASSRALLVGGVLGALAAMTRWEVVLLWPIPLLLHATDASRPLAVRLRRVLLLGGVLAVLFGTFFLLRYRYYGELLPNTYYAKVGGTLLGRLTRGIPYAAEAAICLLVPLTLPVWLLARRSAGSWAPPTAVLVFGLYCAWVGGDYFCWLRFFLPVLPLAAILVVETIRQLDLAVSERFTSTSPRWILATGIALLVVGTSLRIDLLAAHDHLSYVTRWQYVGQWARTAIPSGYRIAIAPVGAMPYFGGHRIIDMLGLTDYETAHFGQTDNREPPGHQMSHVPALLRRAPEMILGNAAGFPDPPTYNQAARQLTRRAFVRMCLSPEFQKLYRYEVVKIPDGYMPLWVRRDIAWDHPDRLRNLSVPDNP